MPKIITWTRPPRQSIAAAPAVRGAILTREVLASLITTKNENRREPPKSCTPFAGFRDRFRSLDVLLVDDQHALNFHPTRFVVRRGFTGRGKNRLFEN